ncbi:MAG: L-glutamate gamma-semialdehyde dehydrogenase [Candidatus Marinimicrobia bacterium]|jgi:1-pyrroline-5-carboxylate dehydrogenase|nr:1-pyrroline-5-carboxylate dehydrogenase [Candidatus Neomarinimicrobiota bacterium]MDP6500581.1 L-glutamate gamma-semialdehyde dehydrogenase [Candidatus Neomarinimicrobiota bacterium]MDP6726146.1 L-glutamate gamma-semialdehyde dehydrogenase [Candidatus Neomarinimicrobiota bacterium]|tara:strand:+ start:49099 stop:50730 length:1632 start_codon:yes stop_codon:yes gene_type:complete
MTNQFTIPKPVNEPIKVYGPGSPEKASLQAKADELSSKVIDIPLVIGGEEVRTGNTAQCVMPHDHGHILANFHQAGEKEVEMAINASQEAWQSWSKKPLEERAEIYVKIANLLAGPWRDTINAATMLNMSKNVFQAEIDAACELIDFLRFNPWYAQELASHQPMYSPEPTKNSVELRPLEGFVFAVSPFNFTSIGGNLPSAPALMGNVALWKPASSAVYPAHFIMQLFKEAGLPDGVINFIPGRGSQVGPNVMNSPLLAGVHFTGSTAVFQGMWKHIGENIQNYKTYPRIVGETGGKDFCLAHESVNKDALVTAMVRGAFEYQGQKCSAMSRAYIPTTIWDDVKEKYLAEVDSIKMGDPKDFTNFMNAVIDRSAFESISEFIDFAKNADDAEILTGGGYDDSKGFFIEPTTILTDNPKFRTMCEEIFGPVLTIYLYDPDNWKETLKLVDSTSDYALTGCVMSEDKDAVEEAKIALTYSAGNFYINDKPTGAVVGQQPFGGSRASGTNDKAGSMFNLVRWVSQRTIKENFDPPTDYRYPFMDED